MSLVLDHDLEPAVAEAKAWATRLHKAAYRGPGDTDEAIRHRNARETGVPASYLLRLHKRAATMADVSGKYARLLRLACDRLDASTARSETRRKEHDEAVVALRQELDRGARPRGPRGHQASLFPELDGRRQTPPPGS